LCALFSDEHSLLFTGSEDMSIRVWQYATEKKRLDLDSVELYELTEHEERVTGLACAEHIL
jgi:WD40 repeat protein